MSSPMQYMKEHRALHCSYLRCLPSPKQSYLVLTMHHMSWPLQIASSWLEQADLICSENPKSNQVSTWSATGNV